MTQKKAESPQSLMPLPPLPAMPALPGAGSLAPFSGYGELARTEKRMERELRRQLLAEEGQRIKTEVGIRHIQHIEQTASVVYAQTVVGIGVVETQAYSENDRKYIHAFCERQKVRAGAYIEEAVDIGVRNILAEINRSVYVAPQKPTFWEEWLLGVVDET